MTDSTLGVVTDHGGAAVGLRLPGGLLTSATAGALSRAATELVENRSVRVVTLVADGPDFCTGIEPDFDPLAFRPDPASALSRLRPPVVAAVTGRCVDEGLELILAADIRVAHPDARFALNHLAAGRMPCWGGSQRLPRSVRPGEATAMMLTGREISADRALSLGLVHALADDPQAEVRRLAAVLLERGPSALELTKEAVHRGSELPLRDGLRLEGDLNHQLAASDDRAEGLQAFFDKRPPDFSGR